MKEQIIIQRSYDDFPDDLILGRVVVEETADVEAVRQLVLNMWTSFKGGP